MLVRRHRQEMPKQSNPSRWPIPYCFAGTRRHAEVHLAQYARRGVAEGARKGSRISPLHWTRDSPHPSLAAKIGDLNSAPALPTLKHASEASKVLATLASQYESNVRLACEAVGRQMQTMPLARMPKELDQGP